MKTLFAIILSLVAISASASSVQIAVIGDSVQPSICLERSIGQSAGLFFFAAQANDWSEAYGGLTYAPIPEVQVAYGVGEETGGNRTGGWVWGGKGNLSAIYLFEDGQTGPWHKVVAKYAVTPRLSLGYIERSYLGEGIYAEYKLDRSTTLKYSGFKEPEIALQVSF